MRTVTKLAKKQITSVEHVSKATTDYAFNFNFSNSSACSGKTIGKHLSNVEQKIIFDESLSKSEKLSIDASSIQHIRQHQKDSDISIKSLRSNQTVDTSTRSTIIRESSTFDSLKSSLKNTEGKLSKTEENLANFQKLKQTGALINITRPTLVSPLNSPLLNNCYDFQNIERSGYGTNSDATIYGLDPLNKPIKTNFDFYSPDGWSNNTSGAYSKIRDVKKKNLSKDLENEVKPLIDTNSSSSNSVSKLANYIEKKNSETYILAHPQNYKEKILDIIKTQSIEPLNDEMDTSSDDDFS